MPSFVKRKLLGLCVRCGSDDLLTTVYCTICNQKNKEKSRRRRKLAAKNKLCSMCCKVPVTKTKVCQICKDKRKDRDKKLYDKGICPRCGKNSLINYGDYFSSSCETCWYKNCSYENLRDRNRWKEIKALLERQNFICALTGDKLLISVNASLDHIIPKQRGGSNNILNLQWILTEANHFKHILTKIELIQLCKKILRFNEE